MGKNRIVLTESQLQNVIAECVNKILKESNDRHREGYWKERWQKQKAEKAKENNEDENKPKKKKSKKKDRHRPGYYQEYNMKHPERLDRGYTKGYRNGNVSDGPAPKIRGDIWFDALGRPHSNDPYNPTFSDLLNAKDSEWHDDDWCEDPWGD